MRTLILAIVLALALPLAARADDPKVSVSASVETTNVSVGQTFLFRISIEGAKEAPEVSLPPLEGVEVAGGQPSFNESTSISIINGRRIDNHKVEINYVWELTPTRPGEIVIPSLEVNVGGDTYKSEAMRVRVSPAEKSDAILLRASIDADEAYVGQLVKLRLTFFTSRSTADLPRFEMPGVIGPFTVHNTETAAVLPGQLAFDFLGSQSVVRDTRTTVNGVGYSAFTVERTIIPTKSGKFTLGPASVMVAIADRSTQNPWDAPRYRRVTASSDPIAITVKDLPKEGMPANFSGLVGEYEIESTATPTDVSVGDPIALTVTVRGPEPLDRVDDPVTARTPGFQDVFRIVEDSQPARRSGGRLVFSRTLRTVTDKVAEIPPIELNFFDPASNTYRTARAAPIPLKVRPTRQITAADAIGDSAPITSGESIASRVGGLAANRVSETALIDHSFDLSSAVRSPAVIAAAACPPAAYALALLAVARRRRLSHAPTRRRQRALPNALVALEANPADPATSASTAIRGYLADTLGAVSGHVLTPDEAHQLLAPRSSELAERVRDLLSRCDAARFAPSASSAANLVDEARQLLSQLCEEVRS